MRVGLATELSSLTFEMVPVGAGPAASPLPRKVSSSSRVSPKSEAAAGEDVGVDVILSLTLVGVLAAVVDGARMSTSLSRFRVAFTFLIVVASGAPTFLGFLASFLGILAGGGAVGGVVGALASSLVVETCFLPIAMVVGCARLDDGVGSPNLNVSEVEEALLSPVATLE